MRFFLLSFFRQKKIELVRSEKGRKTYEKKKRRKKDQVIEKGIGKVNHVKLGNWEVRERERKQQDSEMFKINIYNFPSDFQSPSLAKFSKSFSEGDFVEIVRRPENVEVQESRDDEEAKEEDSEESTSSPFTCPKDGCVKEYKRYSSLENHILYGECKLVHERESLLDKAKIMYREKLLYGTDSIPDISSSMIYTSTAAEEGLPIGWALKSWKKSSRFSDRQKNCLNNKFLIGQATGHKIDPETVSRDMRYAKDSNGTRLFTIAEFLTSKQMQSYFSRTAAKLKGLPMDTLVTDAEEQFAAAMDEEGYQSTRQQVVQHCGLRHPITYQTYNLCQLNKSNGLKQLSIKMLSTICEYFDMDTSNMTGHRKAPYIDLLRTTLQSCSCVLESA